MTFWGFKPERFPNPGKFRKVSSFGRFKMMKKSENSKGGRKFGTI
jgi:hypothetical protein